MTRTRTIAFLLPGLAVVSLLLACGGSDRPDSRPVITEMPQSATVNAGQSATFTVKATFNSKSTGLNATVASEPLRFQWRENGMDIGGATSPTYVTRPATEADSGDRFSVEVTSGEGSVVSSEALLTVNPAPSAPSITGAPKSATITAGQTATFTVTATGTMPLSYQWKKNGVAITDGTASTYTTPAVTTANTGAKYTVEVANGRGSVSSGEAILTVNPAPAAAAITIPPKNTAVTAGQTATFGATATGTAPLVFQWRKNGADIAGATSASYTTPVTGVADNGAKYTVMVKNALNSVISSEATLTVNPAPIQTAWAGFGSRSTGGPATTVVHVRNLNDAGAGSLREALSSGNRTIVFDVGGTIQLKDYLRIKDAHITVDGSTAPAPGITLTGPPLLVANGAHDIILSNFRHRGGWKMADGSRNSEADCISIYLNCYNIVLDHLSVSNYEDEGISSWDNNRDITIQNCILGPGSWVSPETDQVEHNFAMLIGQFSQRVSVYHNLFANTNYRNPAVGWDDANGTIAPSIVGDVVNNVVWDYTGYGTTVYWGGKGNVVGNYYYSSTYPGRSNHAVNTETGLRGSSYASGNYSKDGSAVTGSASTAFAVEAYAQIKATSAAEAAAYVKANAGCRVGGLDAVDLAIVNGLNY